MVDTYESAIIPGKDGFVIRFLYETIPGRLLLNILVRPTTSKLVGSILASHASKIFIRGFIKRNGIKTEEFQNVEYKSFNDYFTRDIYAGLRPFSDNEYDLAAPCDGKLTAYQITEENIFAIKNTVYTITDLLKDKEVAAGFIEGTLLVFRLTPDDYHRYSFIDDGEILRREIIKGRLHTVRPISQQRYKVYVQNAREYMLIQTKNFGNVIQMEVGALLVGKIINYDNKRAVKRGEPKGMFQFGGSTVIMLFGKDSIDLDKTIINNTLNGKETIVKMGNKIGEKTVAEGKETQV